MIARLLKLLLGLEVLVVLTLFLAGMAYWYIDNPGLALALALAIVIGLRALITANNFRLSSRHRSLTPPHLLPGPWQCCRMFLEEFASTMLASSWTMAWPAPCKHIVPAATGLPVLLIHGYACNGGYWKQLSALLLQNRISHCAIDLEPAGAAIDDYVPLVLGALDTLCAETGSGQAILVAHSMGGLVARACLRHPGSARIARIITLGTPHHGTTLASFGPGANALQMRPCGSNAWLDALAGAETLAQRAKVTSIYSHHDNIVAPQSSCHLPGAKNIEFGAIGHVALGRNGRILQCVLEEIELASKQ